MIPFLKNIARTFFRIYGNEVSEFTFVFPNRRSGVFFQKYLAEVANRPLFSPQILTIADLFASFSRYKTADRIQMLFILYGEYIRISGAPESFDEFQFWGEMILNDFDDVDKYLVDAEQLFRNIYDLKEIDAGFSYLSPEQIAAIRRFWANFSPSGETGSKKEFLEMWEILLDLYTSFRLRLQEKGLAYEGMIFREVAERAKAKEDLELNFTKIILVGLNGHSKSEEVFLKYLQATGKADFYFDYSSSLVRDPNNRASFFIEKNRLLFPSKHTLEPEELTFEKPVLEIIGIPSSVGQAKHIHKVLKKLSDTGVINNENGALNTAVVLPDENLLLPVLYSIPEEIEKINVTMGYNLSNSSISGLMDHIFELHKNIRIQDGRPGYYFRFVLPVLSHKYIVSIAGEDASRLRKEIIQYNKVIVLYDEFKIHPLLELIFPPLSGWIEISEYLKAVLAKLQFVLDNDINPEDSGADPDVKTAAIEREFIVEYYKTINKLEDALGDAQADVAPETYFRLLKKLIAGISVPFTGEPLAGLQVMGVLETRALDFENIIVLSFNEGIFPQKRAANSFIPYSLRKGFGLPTYEHQDSIFAYHFYRLINRAKRIFLLYDTRTEGLQTGEVSRYFSQLKHLYPEAYEMKEKLAVYEVSAEIKETVTIHKQPHILEKLKVFLTGERSLSASAVNIYLDCPLQFYFLVVEQMQEEEDVLETIEADTFGSIFHSVVEWLYSRFEKKMVTADLLDNIIKNEKLLTETIEMSFAKNFFKIDKAKKLTGQNYLTGEIIRRYVKEMVRKDKKLTPFIYLESEKRLLTAYTLPSGKNVSLKGFIDRVDEVNGHVRIIDYKTGKGILQFKNIDDLFDKSLKDRPKAVMQVFMYAYLYSLENPEKLLAPGIYYLRNLFSDNFDPHVFFKPSLKESFCVDDFSLYKMEFREKFEECLEEIFDPSIPFTQSVTGKACAWCAFTNICRK